MTNTEAKWGRMSGVELIIGPPVPDKIHPFVGTVVVVTVGPPDKSASPIEWTLFNPIKSACENLFSGVSTTFVPMPASARFDPNISIAKSWDADMKALQGDFSRSFLRCTHHAEREAKE